MNQFDQMREAMTEAETQMRAADNNAERMANMLIGRLRHCRSSTLVKLKRELTQFNSHTKRWNS